MRQWGALHQIGACSRAIRPSTINDPSRARLPPFPKRTLPVRGTGWGRGSGNSTVGRTKALSHFSTIMRGPTGRVLRQKHGDNLSRNPGFLTESDNRLAGTWGKLRLLLEKTCGIPSRNSLSEFPWQHAPKVYRCGCGGLHISRQANIFTNPLVADMSNPLKEPRATPPSTLGDYQTAEVFNHLITFRKEDPDRQLAVGGIDFVNMNDLSRRTGAWRFRFTRQVESSMIRPTGTRIKNLDPCGADRQRHGLFEVALQVVMARTGCPCGPRPTGPCRR